MKLSAVLPEQRIYLGQFFLLDAEGNTVFGPTPVDSKSDNGAAAAAGNPDRDPEKTFGDAPLGDFLATLSYVQNTPENVHAYGNPDATGQIPTIDLTPVEGPTQAWQAYLNGRRGLKIHAGHLNGGQLAPTHGCLRLFQLALTATLAKIATFKGWDSPLTVSVSQKV